MWKSTKLLIYLFILRIIVRSEEILGQTEVFLNGSISVCGRQECNLGNLITDAFVHSRVNHFNDFPQINFEEQNKWIIENVNQENIDHFPQERNVIALLYAKSIAHSIGNQSNINQKYSITETDIKSLFTNITRPIDMAIMSGKRLRLFLEDNLREFDYLKDKHFDNFFQVSGMKVTYDLNKRLRVSKIVLKCQKCKTDIYQEMDDNDFIDVMMPSTISQSYYSTSDDIIYDSKRQSFVLTLSLSLNTSDLVEKYLNQSKSPIQTRVEGRIIINKSNELQIPCYLLIIWVLNLMISIYKDI